MELTPLNDSLLTRFQEGIDQVTDPALGEHAFAAAAAAAAPTASAAPTAPTASAAAPTTAADLQQENDTVLALHEAHEVWMNRGCCRVGDDI